MTRRSVFDDPRLRKRDEELASESLLPELGHQLIGDVPGEQEGMVRLVLEELALLEHGDQRSRDVLADLVRALDLQDTVEDPIVEPHVVDQRACARRGADAIDALAAALDRVQDREQTELRLD